MIGTLRKIVGKIVVFDAARDLCAPTLRSRMEHLRQGSPSPISGRSDPWSGAIKGIFFIEPFAIMGLPWIEPAQELVDVEECAAHVHG